MKDYQDKKCPEFYPTQAVRIPIEAWAHNCAIMP